jgi:hypothetical protein
MLTLDEYNGQRRIPELTVKPAGNNIACPNCHHELVDIPGPLLPSWPPQQPVSCPSCGLKSGRYY